MKWPRLFCKIFAAALGIALLAAGGAFAAFLYFNTPPSAFARATDTVQLLDDSEIRFEVREGESASSVGTRLEEARMIKNHYAWQLLCRLRPAFLKAGMYQLIERLPLLELHEMLTSGRQMLVSVTVPEGSTLRATALIMSEAGICPEDDFTAAAANDKLLREYQVPGATMEGYLYPDTYYFTARYPANLVVRAMADTFYKRLRTLDVDATAFSPQELYAKVILASIIEREYRIEDEAPLIAGVFLRRLKKGMRLESCATVVYVLTEIERRRHPAQLFYRDLEIKSPYNTYLRGGLPPGPIASPGAVALHAAFFPAETDYLFFRVVDAAAGRHYFSRSFDDHIKAGALLAK